MIFQFKQIQTSSDSEEGGEKISFRTERRIIRLSTISRTNGRANNRVETTSSIISFIQGLHVGKYSQRQWVNAHTVTSYFPTCHPWHVRSKRGLTNLAQSYLSNSNDPIEQSINTIDLNASHVLVFTS